MTKKGIALVAVMMVCGAAVFAQENVGLDVLAEYLGVDESKAAAALNGNALALFNKKDYGGALKEVLLVDGASGLASAAKYLDVKADAKSVQKAVNDTKNKAAIAAFKKKDYAGVVITLVQTKVEVQKAQAAQAQAKALENVSQDVLAEYLGVEREERVVWSKLWSTNHTAYIAFSKKDYGSALKALLLADDVSGLNNIAKYLNVEANAESVQNAVNATKNNAAIAACKKKDYTSVAIALVQANLETKKAQAETLRQIQAKAQAESPCYGAKIKVEAKNSYSYAPKYDEIDIAEYFGEYIQPYSAARNSVIYLYNKMGNNPNILDGDKKRSSSLDKDLLPLFDASVRADVPQASWVDVMVDEDSLPNMAAIKDSMKKSGKSIAFFVSPDKEKEYYLITYDYRKEKDAWTVEKRSVVQNYLTAQNTPARSYYVNWYGDDENDGRSPQTPFKTLGKAFSAMRMGTIRTLTVIGDVGLTDGGIDVEGLGGSELLITGIAGRIYNNAVYENNGYLKFSGDKTNATKVRFTNITVSHIRVGYGVTVTLAENTVVEKITSDGVYEDYVGNDKYVSRPGSTVIMTNNARCNSISNNGTFTMQDNATAIKVGSNGTFIMCDNVVVMNVASSGTFTMRDNAVVRDGEGVKAEGIFNMFGNAKITGTKNGNTALRGAGQVNLSGSASISDNSDIAISSNGTVTISENVVIANNASAAIYVDSGTVNIKNVKITGNGGGGIQINGSTVTMSGGEISGNKTKGYGGGVYVRAGTFTFTGGNITGNTATLIGGGIYVTKNGVYNARGGSVTGNTALDGEGNNVFKQ